MTTKHARKAAALVVKHPGVSRSEMSALLRVAPSTAQHHLIRARDAGLIRCDGIGRYARWWPVTAEEREAAEARPWQRVSSVWDLARFV